MNLFNGEIISLDEFQSSFKDKVNSGNSFIEEPLNQTVLFEALTVLRNNLISKAELYEILKKDLLSRDDVNPDEVENDLNALIDFISVDNLRLKLKRELGTEFPFEVKRISMREPYFSAWYPVGILAHVTPNNSPLLSVLAVIEGLLTGNVNLLKLGRKDTDFAILFYSELIKADVSQKIKNYIYIGQVSSKDKIFLEIFLKTADAVSVWGNEESVKSVRAIIGDHAKIIEWGHKISFAFVSKNKMSSSDVAKKLADEICNNEQLACSSPQCVFLEDANFDTLVSFANELKKALDEISPKIKKIFPVGAELAEITIAKEQVRLESYFSNAKLIESADQSFRIFVDDVSALATSPLYRSIWVKPLFKKDIIRNLRPLKKYLQTVGLACELNEFATFSKMFYQAGVGRIQAIGEMTNSFIGEPHDGVMALAEYCRKVSYSDNGLMQNFASIENNIEPMISTKKSIMTKVDFQNATVENKYADLFFYSGGSSGDPKLSVFTYDDYHRQMELAAEGLLAAGLRPQSDRTMNLFYAGSLYGGFVSFFTILEKMEAVQFPMGATTDFKMVADTIIRNNVDTLLGMPSYIMQLFKNNSEEFKKYKGIKKIFFGGEHMSLAQRNYLIKEFGVQLIRSASYGSVDAGPLGFQCEELDGSVYHLHERLHNLEIVELEVDAPVEKGELGRLLFSSKVRHGQQITRYEIGDVGREVAGVCSCGRHGIRFELLGRSGDIFRIGTMFLSYQKFQKILLDQWEYEGAMQIHLHGGHANACDTLEIWLDESYAGFKDVEVLSKYFLENYPSLNEAVIQDKVLNFSVVFKKTNEFIANKNTGKIKSVLEHRL